MKKTENSEEGKKLLSQLNRFRRAGDKQIDDLRKLTYTKEEIIILTQKIYRTGFRKVLFKQVSLFEQRYYTKAELNEYDIWEKLKEHELYYSTLSDFIKTLN